MRVIRQFKVGSVSTIALLVGLLLTAVSSMIVGVQPASAAVAPAVSATVTQYGHPDWYQDASGTRVQPCLYTNAVPSVADPNCILLADASFTPTKPLAFPASPVNFPGEFFYTVADSDKVTTPGCAALGWPALAGGAFTRVAVEGSFVTGVPIAGDQITFARIRIVVRPQGLCPNTTYTFTHPYGTETVTTHADGGVPANKTGFTEDIGCLAAPCNTSLPLSSRVFGGFVRWDATAPAAPAGYLGDGVTLHTITGSPNKVFSITDPATGVVASTNLFAVSGKLSGLVPSSRVVDFGGVVSKTVSTVRTVTVTNTAAAAAAFSGFNFSGTNSGDFKLASNPDAGTCLTVYRNRGVALPKDTSCTVNLIFQPSTNPTVLETAQLNVVYTGAVQSPLVLPLSGTSIANGAVPVVSMSTASLAFPNTVVKTRSATQTVTISNTGTAPLSATASLAGVTPSAFVIVADTCSGVSVAAGSSCSVGVQFAPTVSATTTAILSLTDNAAASPHNVALSGTGTGGLASVSTVANPPGLNSFGFPEWYQDENALQLQPCLNVSEPCVLLADAGFNPALPVAVGNFPVEFFYTVADSDKMNTPGCRASGTGPAKTTYRVGLEGSWLNGVAGVAGDQMSFTRTRIVVGPGGLCPNKTYAFTTPYGTDLVTTDASGGVVANKKGATIDTGCLGAPCDWTAPLTSRTMGGILRWDPSVAPAAPTGFIGDAAGAAGTPHPVVGAPYADPGNGQPANLFRISDPATPGVPLAGCSNALGVVGPCEVKNFTVSGKLATPITASPKPLAFAAQTVATPSAAQVVTLTNTDPLAPVTINSASFVGTNAADYSVVADQCSGVLVAAGGTCTLGVVFTPSVAGSSSAALSVTHTGINTPVQVPISGSGVVNTNAPIANNDSAITPIGTTTTVAVLANDSDPGGLALTVSGVSQPTNGTVGVNADNTVTYTPNAGYNGTDTFTYTAVNSAGLVSNVATVTIQVGGATTSTSIVAPAILVGTSATVTVTVGSVAGTPSGNVSLTVDGGAAITQALGAGGSSVFTVAGLALGSHTLTAAYAAQGTFASSSAIGSVLVQATTTTTISAPAAITAPANAAVTVTVTSASPGLAGTSVSLRMDGGAVLTGTLGATGSASFTITSPAVGTHTLVASYAAQGNFRASSATVTFTVNGSPLTETLTAGGSASRNRTLTSTSWNLQGTTSVLTVHTVAIRLNSAAGALIGTATTNTRGQWRLSVTNSVVPQVGDTITVISSLGTTKSGFAITVR